MHNLLVINGVAFPTPEGSFDIKYKDILNEYTSESGKTVVEIIREDVATISVSYKGLLESKKNELASILHIVNSVTFFKMGLEYTASMKMSDLSEQKKYFRNSLSVWSLSFKLEEL